jgi:NADH dehydrogenase
MRTSLVTVFGGSGFIGRHVVRALAKEGYRIRVATRYPNLAHFLVPMGHVGQIQLVRTNVREPEQVEAALAGASAAINLCGVLNSRGEQSFEGIHVEAAQSIASAARRAEVKSLVHVSAIGANPDSESNYAQSKAEGEKRVREAFPDATIIRPSIVFGPEDAFFNKFAGLFRLVPPIVPIPILIGGGKTLFQPVFVGNVAAGILKSLTAVGARGQTYELGGPNIYSFHDLMRIVLEATDRKRWLVPLPFALARFQAFFLQFLPGALLTPDQVTLLRSDNVVSAGAKTLADLGIVPTSVEAEVPAYLWRFRPKGQYEDYAAEDASIAAASEPR